MGFVNDSEVSTNHLREFEGTSVPVDFTDNPVVRGGKRLEVGHHVTLWDIPVEVSINTRLARALWLRVSILWLLWASAFVELVSNRSVPTEVSAVLWLIWASAFVELVSDRVIPTEVSAVLWLIWASAFVELIGNGAVPAEVGAVSWLLRASAFVELVGN
jgi:hypothetical protein